MEKVLLTNKQTALDHPFRCLGGFNGLKQSTSDKRGGLPIFELSLYLVEGWMVVNQLEVGPRAEEEEPGKVSHSSHSSLLPTSHVLIPCPAFSAHEKASTDWCLHSEISPHTLLNATSAAVGQQTQGHHLFTLILICKTTSSLDQMMANSDFVHLVPVSFLSCLTFICPHQVQFHFTPTTYRFPLVFNQVGLYSIQIIWMWIKGNRAMFDLLREANGKYILFSIQVSSYIKCTGNDQTHYRTRDWSWEQEY